MKPVVICKDCDKEPSKNLEKSTKDWNVFDLKKPCEHCGGQLEVAVRE